MANFHSKPYYDDWVKLASPKIKQFLEKENLFVKNILTQECSVLDVGCGYGRTIDFIHNIPSRIVGIDNSRRMVLNARRNLKGHKNVKISLMNVSNLRFKQKFDFIFCLANTFGNLASEKLKALKEMKKVLNKNGRILIHVYNHKSLKVRLKDYKKARMPILRIDKDGTVHSAEGLKLEQFTKKKLNDLFSKGRLKVKIIPLTPISYMCIATR
jgi:SAM-dependent methyltransferase